MSVNATPEHPTRRERLRQQTVDEIKQRAFELVDASGAHDVTIASVGKAMGMTPPALYRYFPSREALLAALVVDAYADLGSTVATAAQNATGQDARGRVTLIADTYRRWALTYPRRYTMLFSDRSRDVPDSPDGIARVNEGMLPLLTALRELTSPSSSDGATPLDEELLRWGQAIGAPADITPTALRLAVLTWSRMHGLISLEIAGAFDNMNMDAGLLMATEIESVVESAGG
ncbi:TetR/AcrR family transcriptional regulator [Nonomuraea glycinis]|uniref:TetR family transcriptional regulator n=1 Tax=Nonomuraea glycinis TaxID=2047744 RepID=A0A917ZYH4_9ACTN|nr:TetR/AcrR family transcriptional regulator [Nonomuraea glycinis]MCA2175045.1 TetR/AcrR family transcriptional regulator [Nonomuraea glycinis]GGP01012.1 TetR family transcriptional regulator [Nonomuraea glycinis]